MPKRAPPEADAYMLVRALKEARPPKHGRLKEREAGIVWWQDFMARFRALPPEEAMMWDAAAKGVAFSVLFAGTYSAELRCLLSQGLGRHEMLMDCRIG
jgi:hypothetical protein